MALLLDDLIIFKALKVITLIIIALMNIKIVLSNYKCNKAYCIFKGFCEQCMSYYSDCSWHMVNPEKILATVTNNL